MNYEKLQKFTTPVTMTYNVGREIKIALDFSRAILALVLLSLMFTGCAKKAQKVPEPVSTTTAYVVKKNEIFENVLARLLPNSGLCSSIIKVFQNGGFPFRKCFPGDSINILKKDNVFSKLTYYQNPRNIYYVLNNNNHLLMAMKLPYINNDMILLKGEIKSTLYESMLEIGENPNLVFRFADVFAWEIDFLTDTQEGDSFYIFVEKTFCDSIFVDYNDIIFTRYKGQVGDYYGIYYADSDNYDDYYNLRGESLRKSLLKSPLRYSYISSYYSKSRYHPILKYWRPHQGLDYAAPKGAPVTSIGDGAVTFKGWKGGYGNLLEIKHKNNFITRYGHLSKFAKGIHVGQKVKMGELIGYVGSTGLATGPHLHFEMHRNGVAINPLKVNIPRAPSVKKKYFAEFEKHADSLLAAIQKLSNNERPQLSNK